MRVEYVWGGPARDRFLCADKEHAHLVVESAVDGGGPLTWLRKRLASFGRDCLPDLDDPATLGCLLALVREAWGSCRVEVWVYDDGSAGVYVPEATSGDQLFAGQYDTLGSALVFAMEGAP
jgi:hypothetical protein